MSEIDGKKGFLDALLKDTLVTGYAEHRVDINAVFAPGEPHEAVARKIVESGCFPIMAHLGGGDITILHHVTAATRNAVTGVETSARAIAGIMGEGDPVELRSNAWDGIGKGKVVKTEALAEAAHVGKELGTIRTTSTTKDMRAFTFCPEMWLPFFATVEGGTSAAEALTWGFGRIKDDQEGEEKIRTAVEVYLEPMTWLLFVARNKIPALPIRPLPSKEVRRWHRNWVLLEVAAPAAKRHRVDEVREEDTTQSGTRALQKKVVTKGTSAWDKLQPFTRRLFLNAGIRADGTPEEPTVTLREVLDCKNSGLAVRLLRSRAGAMGRDFWVQPDLINGIRNGLIVAESLQTPEGLTPFLTPACPEDLTLNSFEESTSLVEVGGVQVAATGRELRASHGRKGKAGYIIPATMEEFTTALSNYKYLVHLLFDEDSIFYEQCAVAERIIRRHLVDLRSMTRQDRLLPARLLWRVHLRVQVFLRACSEAGDGEVETSALDWDMELTRVGQGLSDGLQGILPPFLMRVKKKGEASDDEKGTSVTNERLRWQYRRGAGRRLRDKIFRARAHPPELQFGRPCLGYHLTGVCHRGRKCMRAASHRMMSERDGRRFDDWARGFETTPEVPPGFPPGRDRGSGADRGDQGRQQAARNPNGRD